MQPQKRTKHTISQQRFDLNMDNPEEKALNKFLKNLANHGRKTPWIIRVLLKAYKERIGEEAVEGSRSDTGTIAGDECEGDA